MLMLILSLKAHHIKQNFWKEKEAYSWRELQISLCSHQTIGQWIINMKTSLKKKKPKKQKTLSCPICDFHWWGEDLSSPSMPNKYVWNQTVDARKMKSGCQMTRPIPKISMDAVIWSLLRVRPSIILASVGKTSFCLIITTKSHDMLRKGNASKKTLHKT